jgi:hypothetical protein
VDVGTGVDVGVEVGIGVNVDVGVDVGVGLSNGPMPQLRSNSILIANASANFNLLRVFIVLLWLSRAHPAATQVRRILI